MKKSRFTEEQITAVLKDLDAGVPAAKLARRNGVHPNTIRLWRDRYAGMEAGDLARLKLLEEENANKDRTIARLTLEVEAMRELISACTCQAFVRSVR